MDIELEATLRVRDGRPHDLNGLTAQLWDEDPVSDDLLAEGLISGTGSLYHVHFRFDPRRAESTDSLGEKAPDLYVLVKDTRGQPLFRSAVHKNTPIGNWSKSGQPAEMEFVEA